MKSFASIFSALLALAAQAAAQTHDGQGRGYTAHWPFDSAGASSSSASSPSASSLSASLSSASASKATSSSIAAAASAASAGTSLASTSAASTSASATASASASASAAPGYLTNYTTLPGNTTFSFGQHYAVLNLDMINGLVASVSATSAGAAWIASVSRWIAAVHAQSPPPLSIFTRIYFSTSLRPEIGPDTPFGAAVASLGNATAASPQGQLYPAFVPLPDYDVVLQKTRYYAGAGNGLEEILASQHIDTVVISGIRTSGVVLSTAYRLFDLNYNVYVIADNSIETPPDAPGIDAAIKQGVLPKLPANVITLDQAIAALARSGPAVY